MTYVLVDECVGIKFGEYLKSKGLEEVISVQEEESMRGMRDVDLGVFAQEYDMILVTRDKEFFNNYMGKKVYFKQKNWRKSYEEIKSFT